MEANIKNTSLLIIRIYLFAQRSEEKRLESTILDPTEDNLSLCGLHFGRDPDN